MPSETQLAIITPSYANDLRRARDLSESVDMHAPDGVPHYLIVPARDVKSFASLANHRRHVLAQEDLLARARMVHLPLPSTLRLPWIGRRALQSQWYAPGSGRVSGWLAQQLVKLASSSITHAESLLFIDSDIQLIRDLPASFSRPSDLVPLRRRPLRTDLPRHKAWAENARSLLGIKVSPAEPFNYVGPLVVWRRSNLSALHAHLESRWNCPWERALLRCRDLSEYMLYGIFCDEILGLAARHAATDAESTCCIWTGEGLTNLTKAAIDALRDEHFAMLVQSKVPLNYAVTRAAFEMVRAAIRSSKGNESAPISRSPS
ncbi:MAG: hypothetical protein RL385_2055 [Pseudomonadota bacterium]|jgi:hypothetical protein